MFSRGVNMKDCIDTGARYLLLCTCRAPLPAMSSGGGCGPISSTGRIINNVTNVQPTAKSVLDRKRLRIV
jgi:hypothetical protein